MQILNRYIIRNMLISLILGVTTVVFIFLMQYLMKHLGNFMGKGFGIEVFFEFILYSVPWMLILAVPMGFLFSMLMGFGSMTGNQEITIIKSSGGSLLKMMRPVIVLGLILTGFLFWFNDYVLPKSNLKAKALISEMKRKRPTMIFEAGQFTSELNGYSIMVQRIDTMTDMMYGMTIYNHQRARKRNIINADSGTIKLSDDFSNFIISLNDGEIHTFTLNDTSRYQKMKYQNYQIFVSAFGFEEINTSTENVRKGDRELSLSELNAVVARADSNKNNAIKTVDIELNKHLDLILNGVTVEQKQSERINPVFHGKRKKGDLTKEPAYFDSRHPNISENINLKNNYSSSISNRIQFLTSKISGNCSKISQYEQQMNKYGAEIHKKYAIPMACLIFVLIGCPLGIMSKKGNFGFAAAMSLLFYIIYWAFLMTGEDFADRGLYPPAICMWLGDIVIATLGIFLTIRVNYESFRFFLPNFLFRAGKK